MYMQCVLENINKINSLCTCSVSQKTFTKVIVYVHAVCSRKHYTEDISSLIIYRESKKNKPKHTASSKKLVTEKKKIALYSVHCYTGFKYLRSSICTFPLVNNGTL